MLFGAGAGVVVRIGQEVVFPTTANGFEEIDAGVEAGLTGRDERHQRIVGGPLRVEHFEEARVTGGITDLRDLQALLRRLGALVLRGVGRCEFAQADECLVDLLECRMHRFLVAGQRLLLAGAGVIVRVCFAKSG